MNDDKKMLEELLGDDITQKVLEELGIRNSSPEMQAELLAGLMSTILKRIALEVLTVLPKSEHAEFERYIGSGDGPGMQSFLRKHIPDADEFVARYASNEFDAIKSKFCAFHQMKLNKVKRQEEQENRLPFRVVKVCLGIL